MLLYSMTFEKGFTWEGGGGGGGLGGLLDSLLGLMNFTYINFIYGVFFIFQFTIQSLVDHLIGFFFNLILH